MSNSEGGSNTGFKTKKNGKVVTITKYEVDDDIKKIKAKFGRCVDFELVNDWTSDKKEPIKFIRKDYKDSSALLKRAKIKSSEKLFIYVFIRNYKTKEIVNICEFPNISSSEEYEIPIYDEGKPPGKWEHEYHFCLSRIELLSKRKEKLEEQLKKGNCRRLDKISFYKKENNYKESDFYHYIPLENDKTTIYLTDLITQAKEEYLNFEKNFDDYHKKQDEYSDKLYLYGTTKALVKEKPALGKHVNKSVYDDFKTNIIDNILGKINIKCDESVSLFGSCLLLKQYTETVLDYLMGNETQRNEIKKISNIFISHIQLIPIGTTIISKLYKEATELFEKQEEIMKEISSCVDTIDNGQNWVFYLCFTTGHSGAYSSGCDFMTSLTSVILKTEWDKLGKNIGKSPKLIAKISKTIGQKIINIMGVNFDGLSIQLSEYLVKTTKNFGSDNSTKKVVFLTLGKIREGTVYETPDLGKELKTMVDKTLGGIKSTIAGINMAFCVVQLYQAFDSERLGSNKTSIEDKVLVAVTTVQAAFEVVEELSSFLYLMRFSSKRLISQTSGVLGGMLSVALDGWNCKESYSKSDMGGTFGWGISAVGSALAIVCCIKKSAIIAVIAFICTLVGLVLIIAFSDTPPVTWIKYSYFGTEYGGKKSDWKDWWTGNEVGLDRPLSDWHGNLQLQIDAIHNLLFYYDFKFDFAYDNTKTALAITLDAPAVTDASIVTVYVRLFTATWGLFYVMPVIKKRAYHYYENGYMGFIEKEEGGFLAMMAHIAVHMEWAKAVSKYPPKSKGRKKAEKQFKEYKKKLDNLKMYHFDPLVLQKHNTVKDDKKYRIILDDGSTPAMNYIIDEYGKKYKDKYGWVERHIEDLGGIIDKIRDNKWEKVLTAGEMKHVPRLYIEVEIRIDHTGQGNYIRSEKRIVPFEYFSPKDIRLLSESYKEKQEKGKFIRPKANKAE
ncbi:MAG: hypothetical protein GY754_29780 [bacterium]|nr:hypothetical protein [bacterium]